MPDTAEHKEEEDEEGSMQNSLSKNDTVTLPSKRKLDPLPVSEIKENEEEEEEKEEANRPNKSQKSELLNHNNGTEDKNSTDTKPSLEQDGIQNDVVEEEEYDDADYEDEDNDDDGVEEEENTVVDRKGKGIMIEEEEEDDDEDDSGSDSDDDDDEMDGGDDYSDLEDDPLAEVDLDNILPSRTRRKPLHPGVFIGKDPANDGDSDNDDDDSDA